MGNFNFHFFGRGKTNFFFGGGVYLQNWLASDHPGAYTSMPCPFLLAQKTFVIFKKRWPNKNLFFGRPAELIVHSFLKIVLSYGRTYIGSGCGNQAQLRRCGRLLCSLRRPHGYLRLRRLLALLLGRSKHRCDDRHRSRLRRGRSRGRISCTRTPRPTRSSTPTSSMSSLPSSTRPSQLSSFRRRSTS